MANVTFLPASERYESANAHALASAASLAYSAANVCQTTTAAWGFPKFKFLDVGDTQCFVCGNDDMVLIAFRGTEPNRIRDVIADINSLQTAGPWGKVHAGFHAALNLVYDEMNTSLTEFRDADQGLFICGHSLGAALATLAAARLAKQTTKINGVYTYGQPRTGDPEFAEQYDAVLRGHHFRFVNNNDVVTRIPLEDFEYRSIRLEFAHVGRMIYITTGKSLSTEIGEFAMTADRVLGRVQAAFTRDFADGISDHNMGGYVAALEANLGNNPFA